MARDKVIVYNDASGKCRVVIPTVDCALSDDAIITKDISASEYSLIDASSLPNTAFRASWKYYHDSKNVIAELKSVLYKSCAYIIAYFFPLAYSKLFINMQKNIRFIFL